MLITGGSSGIGLAVARRLMTLGADLTLVARTAQALESAALTLEGFRQHPGQRVLTCVADVADAESVEVAVDTATSQLGAPDVLVASAGYCRPGRIDDLTLQIFERTMVINYLGTVHAALSCLTRMRQTGRGHLVFISSGAGLMGIAGYAAYSPTKFAIRGFAEVLRAELKRDNIFVSVVHPPDTDTPQLAYERRFKPPETRAITESARILSADEVARAIVAGLVSRAFAITPGLEMTLLEKCGSLLRPLLFRHFDRVAERAMREET